MKAVFFHDPECMIPEPVQKYLSVLKASTLKLFYDLKITNTNNGLRNLLHFFTASFHLFSGLIVLYLMLKPEYGRNTVSTAAQNIKSHF